MKATISQPQNRRLHQLLNQLGLGEEKATLVASYTNNRTEHSKEMTNIEAAALVAWLEVEAMKKNGTIKKASEMTEKSENKKNDKYSEKSQKMRRKIISFAHQLWWKTSDGKADMARIDDWCEKNGKFKKVLNQHSQKELVELVSQFEAMFNKYMKSLANENTQEAKHHNQTQ